MYEFIFGGEKMSKKKNKAHAEHKTHTTSEHKKEHVSDKVSMSSITQNIALIAVVFLVVGVIVGALISYGAFMMSGPVTLVITDGQGLNTAANPVDLNALKLNVKEYVSTNMLPPEVDFAVTSVTQNASGIIDINYTISQSGEVVEKGILYSDGEKLFLGAILLNEDLTPLEPTDNGTATVSQVEVPEAELYIWGYCPGGASTLDTYAEAADYLKDVADIKVVLFSDGHGAFEIEQNKIQAAIQQLEPDKYWAYAKDFYNDVYPICSQIGSVECDLEESTKLMTKVGIDATAVMALVESNGDALYAIDRQKAIDLGIGSSPSLVVNGIVLPSFDRTAEGIKKVICNAFLDAPEECSAALSSAQTAGTGTC